MFSFFKTKLFLFIVLAAVVGTFYYFGDTAKLTNSILPQLKETPLSSIIEKFDSIDTEKLTSTFQSGVQNAETEISTLGEKTVEVTKHTGNVLGSSITTAPEAEQTPVHEKALEYGKYIYCKQVVTDYETLNPTLSK